MKKFVYVGLILLGLSSAAYAGCTSTTLSQCPSPNYNSVKSGAYTDSSGNPMAGVWSGTGFGYTTPPSVAQMAASLSASPQPVTFAAITGTSLNVGTGAITGGAVSGSSLNVGTGTVTGGAGTLTSLNGAIIGATTPEPGSFTTLSSSGAFTPTGGIVGNSTGATPATGNIGYPYTASNSGVTLAANAITNMTSIPLPAGNYNCGGNFGVGTVTAADNNIQAYLSTVSQSPSGIIQPAEEVFTLSTGGVSSGTTISTGNAPLLLTSPKTLYLVVYSAQSTTGSTGNIYCTRVQ